MDRERSRRCWCTRCSAASLTPGGLSGVGAGGKLCPLCRLRLTPRLGWCGGVWGHGEPGSVIGIGSQEEGLLDVERWAEPRREHFVRGVLIKELMRRTGLARNTFRLALRSREPPAFRCSGAPVEARSVQGGDARVAGREREDIGRQGPRADRAARLRRLEDDRRRLPARGATAVLDGAHASAHGLPAWRDLTVGSVGALERGADCQGSRDFPGCDHENSPLVIAGLSAAIASRWARMR
jgi:hypothetical protein